MTRRPPDLDSTPDPHSGPPREESDRLIHIAIAGFIGTAVAMGAVATQCTPSAPDQPRYAVAEIAKPEPAGTFQVTLDARDSNHWIGYDLASGRPTTSAARADLEIRRYVLRAPAGALDLGNVSLEDASVPRGVEWVRDQISQGERHNPALAGWYEYSYWSHVLRSKERTFAVRLASTDGIAYLRFQSYGCEPSGAGCLTLRYRIALGGSDAK